MSTTTLEEGEEYINTIDVLRSALSTTPAAIADPCDGVEDDQGRFILYILPAACVVVLGLSFLKTRKCLCPSCCYNRPAVIYPVNFIEERSRRWAFVVVFAMLSYRVLELFEGRYFWKPSSFDDPDWMAKFGWTKMFVGMINILMLGLVYYPLLACISLRRYLVANITGLLYMSGWLYNHISIWTVCSLDNGGELNSAFFHMLWEAPMLLFLAILLSAYIMDLCINIHSLYKKKRPCSMNILHERLDIEDIKMPLVRDIERCNHDSLSVLYVKALLKRRPLPPPTSRWERLKRKFKYNAITGYKYSPHMMCTMMVAIMALYKVVVAEGILMEWLTNWLHNSLEENHDHFVEANLTDAYGILMDLILVSKYSFHAANITSVTLQIFFMIHIFICHRSNITKMYRGDRSWHFTSGASPAARMVASMKYSGYQIAFILYGYAILCLILFIVGASIAYFIILPFMNGTSSILLDFLRRWWPTILIGIVVYVVQLIVAKFFFLQDRGLYMALENRRVYHVTVFFLFFLNVLLGIFSCLKRVLLSMAFGTLLISRLDKCLLMRGFERFDAGFRAYLGMCEVDVYHTHPVLVASVEIMAGVSANKARQRAEVDEENVELKRCEEWCRRQRIRNKWWKCVTLLNNPTIVIDLLYEQVKNRKVEADGFGTTVIDQLANVATGFVAGVTLAGATEVSDAIMTDV